MVSLTMLAQINGPGKTAAALHSLAAFKGANPFKGKQAATGAGTDASGAQGEGVPVAPSIPQG
eukprot:5002873-Pyramimonas_sp.AAC.1